jgi:hypothetical protein
VERHVLSVRPAPWLALAATLACGAAQSPPCPRPAASAEAPAPRPAPPTPPEPAFAITFAPSLDPPALGVRVRARPRQGLSRWASVTHARPGSVAARDASGPLEASWKDGVLSLGGSPRGFVEIAYTLPARAQGDVVVSPAGYVRFYGEPLLLPIDVASESTHVTIDFDLDKAPVEGVGSSFGFGKHVEADLEPRALASGAWMAGAVFTARFDAYEGKDDFAWIGYSAFDPRWVAAEIATLRTSVSQYFGDKHPPPFTMLLTADRRSPIESTPISIYPRWRGLFAIADLDAPWAIGARMSVATALVARFVGGRLTGAAPLVAGLARYAAREILLSSGTMTPVEYADEIDGEIAATLFADKSPEAAAVARVALDASRIDALLRKDSAGKRTMRQKLLEWVAAARTVTQKDLDDAAGGAAMPADAFGKCFARAPTRFSELDLGFDEKATRASMKLTAVYGPARKAGLREGDPLVSIRYDEGQAERPVRVVVSRDGKNVEVKYPPTGRSKTALGWRVAPNFDPSTCTR